MTHPSNPYAPVILSLLPRILTNLDRDSTDPLYGCFDRSFWHLKTQSVASAVLQQATLVLARCYLTDFPGNIYYRRERIREWIEAALLFWARQQNRDGSFDEYWKGEGSFPATAFSLFAATEAALLLGIKDERLFAAMQRAASFLAPRTERFAMNQEIVSTAALHNLYLLLRQDRLSEIFHAKIESLKALQSPEGFFPEHGGADAGYSAVALEYLSLLHEKTGRADLRQMCERLIGFLAYYVHPDNTVGGRCGSRNTAFYMPGGLEYCAAFSPLSASIASAVTGLLREGRFEPLGIDERYWLHCVGFSFARALLHHKPRKAEEPLPSQVPGSRLFPEARLYAVNSALGYLIVNLEKGGVLRLSGRGAFYEDTGYRLLKGRRVFDLEFGGSIYRVNGSEIMVEKRFCEKKYLRLTPPAVFFLFFYSALCGNRFWDYFRRRFIQHARGSAMVLKRRITWEESSLRIEDEIVNADGCRLVRNPCDSMRCVPSSKFFHPFSLSNTARVYVRNVSGVFRLSTVVSAGSCSVQEQVVGSTE